MCWKGRQNSFRPSWHSPYEFDSHHIQEAGQKKKRGGGGGEARPGGFSALEIKTKMIQLNNPYTYFIEYTQTILALGAILILVNSALEPSSNNSRSVTLILEGNVLIAVSLVRYRQEKAKNLVDTVDPESDSNTHVDNDSADTESYPRSESELPASKEEPDTTAQTLEHSRIMEEWIQKLIDAGFGEKRKTGEIKTSLIELLSPAALKLLLNLVPASFLISSFKIARDKLRSKLSRAQSDSYLEAKRC